MSRTPHVSRERWPTTSHDLLRALRDPRESAAWARFEASYRAVLHALFRLRGLQPADGENLAQTVLLEVSRSIHTYVPERGRFRSWLATIAIRVLQRHFGERLKRSETPLEHPNELEESADRDWRDWFDAALMEAARVKLQPEFTAEQWRVFELYYRDRLPLHAVAAHCHLKPHKVFTIVNQIRERWHRAVDELLDDIPNDER